MNPRLRAHGKPSGKATRKQGSPRHSQSLRLRPATVGDIETLAHQRRAMWEDMGIRNKAALDEADQVYRRWARTRLKDGTLLGWVAETQNGTIAGGGCLWLQPIQPRPGYNKGLQPYLLSMYTKPGFRGRGVASQVVRAAVYWTGRHGYPTLRLHASDMGRDVYRRLGFKRAWEMKLDLQ